MSSAPHVVINALFLDPGASGGPETYLRGLVPALADVRPSARITVATTRRGASSLRSDGWPERGIAVREMACDDGDRLRRQLAEQLSLPALVRRIGGDALHSLASVAPIRTFGVAHVITLHDVNFIHHQTFNPITSWGMRQVVPRAARRADALIADTAVARDDVCVTLGIDPNRFTVVPLAAAPLTLTQPTAAQDVRSQFALTDGPIVLCVGAKRPHKNQAVLIRALPMVPEVQLVLVGHAEPYERLLRSLARELGVEARVRFAGWLGAADLEGLWAVAAAAALPTLAEGFGLPLLEAMSRGVPIAASDIPVLREVGGHWPVYFDPLDPSDAARAVRSVLNAPPDRDAGRRWAMGFSWDRAARGTWSVYDRVLAVPGAGQLGSRPRSRYGRPSGSGG